MIKFWRWLLTPRIEPAPELWVEVGGKLTRLPDRDADSMLSYGVIFEDDNGVLCIEIQGRRWLVRVRPSSARRRGEQ